MPSPYDLLSHFGFSSGESEVYLATLALGRPSVADIGKKIGKNRTAVYFHVNNLMRKGLLKETRQGKKKRFLALQPNDLSEQFERYATDFKSLVPQLEALKKIDIEAPVIEVIESRRGYFQMYNEAASMPEGSIFYVIEGKTALKGELSLLTKEQWSTFFKRMAERRIITKGIFTDESLRIPKTDLPQESRAALGGRIFHLHTLPEASLPFEQLLCIYGDKVAFLFPEQALIITMKHHGIAQSLVALFEGLWLFAKPVPQAWKEVGI
ncbi:MAG: helix-turn-helix domain-containing protein [Patescibacteria group bacterium]